MAKHNHQKVLYYPEPVNFCQQKTWGRGTQRILYISICNVLQLDFRRYGNLHKAAGKMETLEWSDCVAQISSCNNYNTIVE